MKPESNGMDEGSGDWAVWETFGFTITLDVKQGHLVIEHDGSVTWEQLQQIKNMAWGENARAIEVFPSQRDVINKGNIRHLWRLGEHDFAPDLLGREGYRDGLQARYCAAWAEARG